MVRKSRRQRQHLPPAAFAFGVARSNIVDDDAAHDARCVSEEGTPILPRQTGLLLELQPDLMDETRSVEHRELRIATEAASRQLVELRIDAGEETLACAGIPGADFIEEPRNVPHASILDENIRARESPGRA